MLRAIPFILAAIVIVGLTVVEGSISERWVDQNIQALYCASLLEEVPNRVGDWTGKDDETSAEVLLVAGAEGYVSRQYKNSKDQSVALWLIVGHARDTAVHTPDSCYPASGFKQTQDNTAYLAEYDGIKTKFWTATFKFDDGVTSNTNRVFWTWFKPNPDGTVEWVAPDNPRFKFGSTRALYKMYFTANVKDPDQEAEESVCLEFARTFVPVVTDILKKANDGVPEDFVAEESEEKQISAG